MGLIEGRPTIDVILERAQSTNGARFIAQRLQRVSPLLQLLEFDNSVIPNGRSGRLTFTYDRGITARVGQLRNWYQDYTARYTTGKTSVTVPLRPIGDAVEVDRVFARADDAWVQEQIDSMAPAIKNTLTDMIVNGDPSVNALELAGISKILTGTDGEIDGSGMDFSASSVQTDRVYRDQINAIAAEVDDLTGLGLTPIILANRQAMRRVASVGEGLNYLDRAPDQFGITQIRTLNGAYMIDSGLVTRATGPANSTTKIIPTGTFEVIPTVSGLTDIYVLGISRVNGLCGVTLDSSAGTDPIIYQTARTDAGVLRRFEAELVAGLALLDERAAKVFRDVKVA